MDAEDIPGAAGLALAQLPEQGASPGDSEGHLALLAPGGPDDDRAVALGDGLGDGILGADGLVVGVGVEADPRRDLSRLSLELKGW